MFDCRSRTLNALELKSTQSAVTFWRKDFEEDSKKHTYNIKKKQILGLEIWSNYLMNCGFVFNFRNHNNPTFFVRIRDVLSYTSKLNKKSLSIDDVLKMNPVKIKNELLRTNYKYDIDTFLEDIKI